MIDGERLLKAREVAEMLDVSVATVLDHFEAGDLPGFRLYGRRGGPVRFRPSDIEATLASWRHGRLSPSDNKGPGGGGTPRTRGTGGDSSDAGRILRLTS